MPVYEVKPENEKGRVKVLHRNLLLPCDHLVPDVSDQTHVRLTEKPGKTETSRVGRRKTPAEIVNQPMDYDSSDAEEEYYLRSRWKNPEMRKQVEEAMMVEENDIGEEEASPPLQYRTVNSSTNLLPQLGQETTKARKILTPFLHPFFVTSHQRPSGCLIGQEGPPRP